MMEKYTQKEIDEQLKNKPDLNIGDLTNKKIEEIEYNKNSEEKVFEILNEDAEKINKKYYAYIALNVLPEEKEDLAFTKEELAKQGINVTEDEIKKIKKTFFSRFQAKDEQRKKLFEELKEKKPINDQSIEDVFIKNSALDSFLLNELCTREIRKGKDFEEENKIKNMIINIIDDYDDFINIKQTYKILKIESENGNYKNFGKFIELEIKLKELFTKKGEQIISEEYRNIFID